MTAFNEKAYQNRWKAYQKSNTIEFNWFECGLKRRYCELCEDFESVSLETRSMKLKNKRKKKDWNQKDRQFE